MPIKVTEIQPHAYMISYHGKVTAEQLDSSYREILELDDLVYLLVDATGMVYTDEMLMNDDLGELMIPKLADDMMKAVVIVLPADHPLREGASQFYDSMGYLHKVKFVASQDEGIQFITQSLKK